MTDFIWIDALANGEYWLLYEDQLPLPFGRYDRLDYLLEIGAPGPFTLEEAIRGSYTVGETL